MVENICSPLEWSSTSDSPRQHTEFTLTSDTSGGWWGCGAWHNQKWFQLTWDERTSNVHIAIKELIPIMIAALVWGRLWTGGRVIAHCDNTAVVSVLNSRYSQDKMLLQTLRGLFFTEANFQFQPSAVHLPGTHNGLADDLSRNHLSSFLRKRGTDSTLHTKRTNQHSGNLLTSAPLTP